MAKSVSPVINLFGNSNLFETPEVVEVPKEHLSLLQPLDLSAYKLSPGAAAAGAGVDKLFSSLQSKFEAQTAQSQAYLDAQRKQIAANMEAVIRMQEERKKAEEEARKKAEKEAEEAKKELEKSIDEDPSAIIRPGLDAVINSEVYKNAGDKQKRDLLAEAAKQYETKLTAQGLDSKYVKKLVDTFKINGERDVVGYINKSEKDDWDIVTDLIVPVKGAIDRSRAAMHTKDARTIDQAIADLKAGKEVSGWEVDEILDRDPSLRKYLDVTSGVYSGITQGVGSTFKLKAGAASEFTNAANKTWGTAIDKAVSLESNAQKIDASRSADAQRHWKNYDYEAAKIDNAEKTGQISGFDSFLSHGKLFLSNPTVPLDKAAPSLIKAVGETIILDRTANAATAAGAAVGSVVPVLGTAAGAAVGRVAGTTVSLARKAMPFLASAVVSGKATEEEIINNARETISALDVNNKDDLKTLQAMPGWNELLARSDNNPELAKLRMSAFASEDAAFAGAITGAIAGLVGPEAFLAKGATKLIVRSNLSKPATFAATVGKTAGGAALSSASEGAEEAMTQYLSNYASIYGSDEGRGLTSHLKATWGEAPLMEGVANAAAQGIGVGLIAGGAGGAMGFRSDLVDTEKAISQQRIKNEVNFIKNGVETLTNEVDTLLASGKVDQKVLTETLLSGFRTQTKELSATANKYSYRDEQQGKQMVYDHIIEPVLERSGITTEQAAEVVRKINTAFPEVNINPYAQATDTAFIKALKADTLEQAEAIYGKPLSTLRADTWRVYNNKDTGSVTNLDQAQAAATLVRSVLSEGDVSTVHRAGAVIRNMYGYRNADNKLVDGIIHKHPNLSDSQLDAILELAKTELDAYNRRETNEERQAREQGEQTGQQPNNGGVSPNGGNGSVTVGTPSQDQDQANQDTKLGELGGQEQGGQATTTAQGGGRGRTRQTAQSADASDVTAETSGSVAGTTETPPVVQDPNSTPTPRQPSATPTSDGGNGQTVQAPEPTGPADTPTKGTPDGSGVTGATQTERSTNGKRPTATTEANFEQLKAAIQHLPKDDLASVKEFAYLSFKESANLRNKNATTLEHMATAMMNISMTDAAYRYDSVASVYLSDAAKRYKYSAEEVEDLTNNILDIHARLMDPPANGTDGKKSYLGDKKAKPVDESKDDSKSTTKPKGKGGSSKKKTPDAETPVDESKDDSKSTTKPKGKGGSSKKKTPDAETPVDESKDDPKSTTKPKPKPKPKSKRGTKNDEETTTGQQTTATRTDDETSENGLRADDESSDVQSGTVRKQDASDDGKNQTTKSTDADDRQDAEVVPFGTLAENTTDVEPEYVTPVGTTKSTKAPQYDLLDPYNRSHVLTAIMGDRAKFAKQHKASLVGAGIIKELHKWYKREGEVVLEHPLFPVLHELLNRLSITQPELLVGLNTDKARRTQGSYASLRSTVYLNRWFVNNRSISSDEKGNYLEDTAGIITIVHELGHAVTARNLAKKENTVAFNTLADMRDSIIKSINLDNGFTDLKNFIDDYVAKGGETVSNISRSKIDILGTLAYGLSLTPTKNGNPKALHPNNTVAVFEFIAVGMSDPAMATLIDKYVDVKAVLKRNPQAQKLLKAKKRTAWQAFADIVLSVLGKSERTGAYDVYRAIVESVMYEQSTPLASSVDDNTWTPVSAFSSFKTTFKEQQEFMKHLRVALFKDLEQNYKTIVPPTTLEQFKQRIRTGDATGVPIKEHLKNTVQPDADFSDKPIEFKTSDTGKLDITLTTLYSNQVFGEKQPKWATKPLVKALLDIIPDVIKKTFAVVSISLAALTGTAMVVPVDAQASTTTYTQTDLSQQVKDTASHVVQTKDNGGKPFIVADKLSGNITLFDANGKVLTTAPALYGSEVGDTLQGTNRQTPAGRFTLTYSKDDKSLGDMQVLDGVSMQDGNTNYVWAIHRVINPKGENRLKRLSSKTYSDNRISNGCINVPAGFFNKHLNQQFDGVLYVLPETANFDGILFTNTTVSDRANPTAQSGQSGGSTRATSTDTPNATTATNTTPTAEQIGNIGKHPLLTADEITAANNRILGLPDEAPTPADEPARVGDNPSTQQAVIEVVTIDGKSYTTALVEQGQLTPAEERADTTFDTLPTTEKSSDGFSVSDIAIALGSLVGLGAGIVRLRRVRRNGKVEVEPVLDDTEDTADTETVTETPTEPKSTTDKLKSLVSRKKQPAKPNRRVVENDQDLVSQIRSELMALEDLQDNIAAQQLLYAMAGTPSALAVGYAANWNSLMRSINAALHDDTNVFKANSKTFSWRIDRKGADDESKANGPISSLYNRYVQFSGGATPNFDRFLELTGGKRIGLMQDSFKLSADLAKINATRNALFGTFNTRVLKDIENTMLDHEFNPEYAERIKALGKKPSKGDIGYSIPHDFGMYATYMHAYYEAYDWQIKSMTNVAKHHDTEAEYALDKALEIVRKYTDDEQVIDAIADLIESDRTDGEIEVSLRSYDISHNDLSRVKRFKRDFKESMTKADRQYELIDNTQEYYENAKDVTGKTDYPLPIGMTKQDIEAKMKALEDLYGKDALEKTAKSISRANELAVQEAVMRGGYTSQELATIKAAGFKMYVPLHKAKSETDATVGDVLEAGYFDVYEEASREYRTMGLTPDLVRYHRKGMTSPPNDAYTNLLPFVQNQMGRAAESDFKHGIRELAEGTNPTIDSLSAWKKDGVIEYTDTEGLIRIPASASASTSVLPEYLRNHVGVRMRGTTVVEVPHETERGKFVQTLVESDYIYYFTDIKVQNELTHVAQSNDKLRRSIVTNNLYTIQRWQATLMTSKRPVWNLWNFFKEASERTITMMFRPVADADGNRISSRKLAATNIKNLAKISSSMELQAEITDYIRYREVTTPLQRILAEMDDAGALQLYTSTVDRHNAMQDEFKSELDKFVESVGKNTKKLASKYKVSNRALSNTESLADWYQTRLVETPQVVNALATYMTYKQLGVNKKEATNRTRDMFDPLRLNAPAVNKLASFFPFVRSILAGNYNTARTVDMITQDPKMAAIAVLGVMSSVALLALALSALGDDDETGEPYAERLKFDDLSRGLPIRVGKDVFFIPMGFGAPNILWSMGAGIALGTINKVEPSEVVSNTIVMALKNTVPFSPASGEENHTLAGVLLSFSPAMIRPVAEVMFNQRAFGGSAIVTARNVPEGYDKADVSAWGTPEAYKDLAKVLAGVGLDMHPEQLRHLIQSYALQGPLRAIDAALQDKGEKSGGVLVDKGETIGPLMTALGADINYQTNRFSYRNAFYDLQEKEKEILKKYGVTATRSGADTLDEVTSFAGVEGLDSSRIKQEDSNIARVRNELIKKGATLDEVQFIIDMNYAKLDYRNATSEAGKAATHYYRGVKSGEASDKTAPSVFQEQFLMAELEMNQFVKKYLRLLSED